MHIPRLVAAVAFVVAVTLGSGVTDSSPALAKEPCTKTVLGNCIQGGHRCAKAMYAKQGWNAAGKSWYCKGSRSKPRWERSRCAKRLDQVFRLERSTSKQGIDSLLDGMGARCPKHYKVFTDYVSVKGMAEQLWSGGRPCAEYRVSRYAIAYLRQDGYCRGCGHDGGGYDNSGEGRNGSGGGYDSSRSGGGYDHQRQQEQDDYYYYERQRQEEDDYYYEQQRQQQEQDDYYEQQRQQQEQDDYYEQQRQQQEHQDQQYQNQYYDQGY